MNVHESFSEKHGLRSSEQTRLALELKDKISKSDLHLVRLAWVDSHGAVRAKALTVPVFLEALDDGYNINVATSTLDASGGRIFSSFTQGGGMGLDEMTGSPNLIALPDPETFRTLPWAPGVSWVLCDEYFNDGTPFHFSTRRILKQQLARLEEQDYDLMIGLEVEFYITKIAEQELGMEHVGRPGLRGKSIQVTPVEPGYSYHSESSMDIMQPILSELARVYTQLGLPLRSVEKEWGPGQVECTFTAQQALHAADNYILMRTATRQVCRRHGYLASFMCRPGLDGFYPSGWHLHQSLQDRSSGTNLFAAGKGKKALSGIGNNWLAGLMGHAVETVVFATPTINGYGRFMPNSLAPDRVSWGIDHRGTMFRVLFGVNEQATRLENRSGEPAANPYLFIASQIAAGLDGIQRQLVLPTAETDPYKSDNTRLPDSLEVALDAAVCSELCQDQFGSVFMQYYQKLKQAELQRYNHFLSEHDGEINAGEVTPWEQDEYFDFF